MGTVLQTGIAALASSKGFRPPQWIGPATVQLIVPPSGSVSRAPVSESNQSYTFSAVKQQSSIYVFDAVIRNTHSQQLRKTIHPVQTGASVSPHAYLMPPEIELEIGMSDAMQQYAEGTTNFAALTQAIGLSSGQQQQQITPWTGSSQSKSVNAYQQLLTLQRARTLLNLVTRIRSYQNMLITSIDVVEDATTKTSLMARVRMEMILTASVSTVPVTEAIHDTQTTSMGIQTGTTLNSTTLSQYQVSQSQLSVTGAGTMSSLPYVPPALQPVLTPPPALP
jgi:hypothetical protein